MGQLLERLQGVVSSKSRRSRIEGNKKGSLETKDKENRVKSMLTQQNAKSIEHEVDCACKFSCCPASHHLSRLQHCIYRKTHICYKYFSFTQFLRVSIVDKGISSDLRTRSIELCPLNEIGERVVYSMPSSFVSVMPVQTFGAHWSWRTF